MYSDNILGNFGGFDQYGIDDSLGRLQDDTLARMMDDPFMFKAFLRNVQTDWGRYWRYRDELNRDVSALSKIDSDWIENSISLNTEHTVYGNDAKAVILRMRTGKITTREDVVEFAIKTKNNVNLARNFRSAKSLGDVLEDLISVTTLLDEAVDQLIRDNARLIENMLSEAQSAANDAEKLLNDWGGFTFRYNMGSMGLSIDVSKPPSTGIHPYEKHPYNSFIVPPSASESGSSSNSPFYYGSIPPYNHPPYAIYVVKPGDSFWKIAAEQMGCGAKYEELAVFNHLTPSSTIHPGNELKIPL